MMTPNAIMILLTLPTMGNLGYLFFYESDWGFMITTFALMASMMAQQNPESKTWKIIAIYST
jgi:hypothetical protein